MKGFGPLAKLEIGLIIIIIVLIITFLLYFKVRIHNFYTDVFKYISYNNIPELFLSLSTEYEWEETYYNNQPKKSYCNNYCSNIGNEKILCKCKTDVPYLYLVNYDNDNKKIYEKVFNENFADIKSIVCVNISSEKFYSLIYDESTIECLINNIIDTYSIYFPLMEGEGKFLEVKFKFLESSIKSTEPSESVPIYGP